MTALTASHCLCLQLAPQVTKSLTGISRRKQATLQQWSLQSMWLFVYLVFMSEFVLIFMLMFRFESDPFSIKYFPGGGGAPVKVNFNLNVNVDIVSLSMYV